MTLLRRVGSVYLRIGRTYLSWGPSLLLLALIVFLPIGLLETIPASIETDELELDSLVEIGAVLGAVAVITATSLLGEVFYSGAVAVSLTHPRGERPPSLVEIARRLAFRRLIAVDLVYVAIVIVGLLLFVVPGALAFVFFALAGPVVEIEGRGVRAALARSWHLVRGSFWVVALVLVPIEVVGDSIGEALGHLIHDLLGHSFFATWIADTVANLALTPIFALAAVLLTLDLIARKEGDGPQLNPVPTPARSAA